MSRLPTDGARDLWELPDTLRALVENELAEGESVVWVGQPSPRRMLLHSLPIVLFAIPWTAFAIFWTFGAAGFKVPDFQQGFDFFPLFGIPFILIGLGMFSAPYWVARSAKQSVYALTNRRAIVFAGGWWTTVRSFGPERLNDLRRTQRPDGSGNLIFECRASYDSDNHRRMTETGFMAIPNVKHVEDLVRQVALAAAKNPGS